jgi:hypothetical protein
MVHVTAQSRYGAINTYKANTHGFNRVFRAILAVLEDLSNTYQCSPEGALALIRPHLTLGPLEVVDEPMDVDIRHDEDGLKRYLEKAHLGRQGFLLQVVDLLIRLETRDGYEALSQIELAAIQARGSVLVQTPVEQPTVAPVSTQIETPEPVQNPLAQPTRADKPKKTFRTRKASTPPTKVTPEKPPKVTSKKTSTDTSSEDDFGQLLQRSRDTLAKTKETLAQTGQVVTTNPLLNDFL